jgi:hypothetical protein
VKLGAESTVRTAPVLVAEPAEFVATTLYVAASALLRLASVSALEVAPLIETPFFFHCSVGVGEPVATTEKETLLPVATVWLAGWVVKVGAETTLSTAPVLVAEPAEFVATTLYVAASAPLTLARVSVLEVAPLIETPFFLHCSVGTGEPVATTEKETLLPAETDLLTGCVVKLGADTAVWVLATLLYEEYVDELKARTRYQYVPEATFKSV